MRSNHHNNPWTPEALAKLYELRGQNLSYRDIGKRLNHTAGSYQSRMHKLRKARGESREVPSRRWSFGVSDADDTTPLRDIIRDVIPAKATNPNAPMARGITLARAQTAAETADLRDRIERYGIGVALCGDPPPGRSALDQTRAGTVP